MPFPFVDNINLGKPHLTLKTGRPVENGKASAPLGARARPGTQRKSVEVINPLSLAARTGTHGLQPVITGRSMCRPTTGKRTTGTEEVRLTNKSSLPTWVWVRIQAYVIDDHVWYFALR